MASDADKIRGDVAASDDPIWAAPAGRVGLGMSPRERVKQILEFGDFTTLMTHGDVCDCIRRSLAPLVPLLAALLHQSKLHQDLKQSLDAQIRDAVLLYVPRRFWKRRMVPGLGIFGGKPTPLIFPKVDLLMRTWIVGPSGRGLRSRWSWRYIVKNPGTFIRKLMVVKNYLIYRRSWSHRLGLDPLALTLDALGNEVKQAIFKRGVNVLDLTTWESSLEISKAIHRWTVASCLYGLDLPLFQRNPSVPDTTLGKRRDRGVR